VPSLKNLNTVVSYALRSIVGLHAATLGTTELLFVVKKHGLDLPGERSGMLLMAGPPALICVLLLLDWTTRKDPSRRYSRQIDSILGIGWVLAVGSIFVWALSQL
jgi:hypothetical protein